MISFEEWIAGFHTDLIFRYCRKGEAPPANGIVVWEDEWQYRNEIVRSRVRSKLGLLEKVPGRLGVIRRITSPEADAFLQDNHLQGSTAAKLKYGLFLPEKYFRVVKEQPEGALFLMAVMTFSAARTFRDGSKSYELIRFAVRCNYHVQGGFSRLLQHFIREKDPDSIMTYVDRNWYTGSTYEPLGFEAVDELPPIHYRVDADGQRVPTDKQAFDVMNRGSIKMIWKKKSS